MNLLGKIFVFLILFFSVAFMTMAMMVYATHRNWREEIERTDANRPGWKQKSALLKTENDELQAKKEALDAQYKAEVIAKQRAVAALEQQLKLVSDNNVRLGKELAMKAAESGQLNETSAALAATNKSLVDTDAKLRESLVEEQKMSDTAFKSLVSMSDKYHELLAKFPALEERSKQLTANLAKATALLGMVGRTPEDPLDLLPPPVDGTITALSKRDDPNLVELSLGKDDGLRVNHRVDLHRGNKYLGYALVTDVNQDGKSAVAKMIDRKEPVRPGDNFTTRLQYKAGK